MRRCVYLFSFCLFASLAVYAGPLGKLVVIGDSLSAGFQNFSLYTSETIPGIPPGGQQHGFAQLIAQQAGTDLRNPTVLYPGLPPTLTISAGGDITRASGIGVRLNPLTQTLNLSVPSYTVGDALGRQANIAQVLTNPLGANPVDILELTVLGPPSYCGALDFPLLTVTLSSVACAVQQNPDTILVSLGSNDALQVLTFGAPAPTDPAVFGDRYHSVMTQLKATGARIMVANVPDVTLLPYLWTRADFAHRCHFVPKGTDPKDYLVPNLVDSTSSGDVCTSYQVRTAAQVETVRSAAAAYNAIIAEEAKSANALVLDLNGLFSNIAAHGIMVGQEKLTTSFLGGLFSLDGMHPSDTGYAIIANEAINTMNAAWGMSIPLVSTESVAATDPLVPRH